MTFLIIISGRKEDEDDDDGDEGEGKDSASDYDRKVTIPDEFVHECQSFIFFFFFFFFFSSSFFPHPALLFDLVGLLFIPLSASSNHEDVLVKREE